MELIDRILAYAAQNGTEATSAIVVIIVSVWLVVESSKRTTRREKETDERADRVIARLENINEEADKRFDSLIARIMDSGADPNHANITREINGLREFVSTELSSLRSNLAKAFPDRLEVDAAGRIAPKGE